MIEQKPIPTRLLLLGVKQGGELEQKLGDRYDVRREDFDGASLQEQNRERAVEVVIVGRQHILELETQIESDPVGYRSHISIGAITDRDRDTSPAPFDGIVPPLTDESVVRNIEHLSRLTEAKRVIDTLYHLSRALGYMESNHPTVEGNKTYSQLRKCQREISDEFNELGAQICKTDAYALFESVGTLCDEQGSNDAIEGPKNNLGRPPQKGCE